MNLATIRAALEAWVESVTGIGVTYWGGRPQGWAGPSPSASDPAAYCEMQLRGGVAQGEDSLEWDYDATAAVGSEMTPVQRGNRELTWEVHVHSYDAGDGTDAWHYVELLRDSIRLPAAQAALDGAGLGLQAVLAAIPLPSPKVSAGRVISSAVLEVRLNAEAELEGSAIGYVETFEMLGELDDAAGGSEVVIDGLVPS